jgi:hypothetical protein
VDRLIHDVARYQERGALLREPPEQLPELGPQDRILTDRRLVEDQELRPTQQRGREGYSSALAARQVCDGAVRVLRQVDSGDLRIHLPARDPQHPREVRQVLAHG